MKNLKLKYRFAVLANAWKAKDDIKRTLRHKYWRTFKRYNLDFAGIKAEFTTEDFYSNYWFYELIKHDVVYEPAITKFILEKLKKARAFADVGANIGYFSVVAAKMRPDIPIHAFEMDQTLASIVKRNLELNKINNVIINSCAIGAGDGVVNYKPHPFSFFSIIYNENIDIYSLTLSANIVSLDCYFKDKELPNLIKIDIDGAEMSALLGMSSLLEQQDVEILLELHCDLLPKFSSSLKEVELFVKERNFRFAKITNFRESSEVELEEIYNFDQLKAPHGDMIFVSRNL